MLMSWRSRSYVALGEHPKYYFGTRQRSFVILGALLFLILLILLIVFHLFPPNSKSDFFALSILSGDVCNDTDTGAVDRVNEIPNFVHYVWILKDPSVLRLDFKLFISFYSAHLYFQPDIIYLHTDATPEVFEQAKSSGDEWTRRTLAIPNVTYRQVTPLTETRKGIPLHHLEHKADFLRMDVLHEFGGIYMDSDAVPLRDITDLRHSGFANVVGGSIALTMKHSGKINNGVMMSVPRSALMDMFIHAAHQYFDGSWALASVLLLTNLANRLAAIPNQVLVLQPSAFAPISWEFADQKRLFEPHAGGDGRSAAELVVPGPAPAQGATCQDVFHWLEAREKERDGAEGWEIDFSSTYVLHAFDDDIPKIGGWDHKRDLDYVLARRSNYARAVYPAVSHAVKAGIIPQ